jgi:large subunit ribosomal protein L1
MGQKRIKAIDLTKDEQVKVSPKKRRIASSGKGQTGRLTDMGAQMLAEEEARQKKDKVAKKDQEAKKTKVSTPKKKKKRERSRRYRFARSLVDRTKTYSVDEAINLVKKTSISRFDGTLTAHLNLNEAKLTVEVKFPHPTGKSTRIAIATDKLLNQIKKGKTDFDILLASPDIMPQLVPLAKILGPKGLMPNPKNNTIVADPQKRKQELEAGTAQVKTEAKAPLMHVTIGKTSQPDSQLKANLTALITAVKPSKIKKLTLAPTMGPGVKIDLTEFRKN